MRLWRFPDQVLRLAVVFILAIAALVFVRRAFVPASFGDEGHFRADAIAENAALPLHYAGAEACTECHEDQAALKVSSFHRSVACENCHGAAAAHVDAPDEHAPLRPTSRDACLTCHRYLYSRPTGFPQVMESLHNPDKACISCHDAHDPTPPHVPTECGGCHASVVRTKAVSPHARLECSVCHDAPEQHREAPRLHAAGKPTGREFCAKCHARDAVSEPGIPRIDLETHGERYVCWQCHYPHYPEG